MRHAFANNHLLASAGVCALLIFCVLFSAACTELEKPKPEPFYSETAPPVKQEFRWSNGKMPKSFDPARAAAPPETDVIRAIFEGLTDTDAKTLKTVPALATEWKASEDLKTWTFILRRDAKWSNGERITAQDFVRSWKRLTEMREKVSHPELLNNIIGLQSDDKETFPNAESDVTDILTNPAGNTQAYLRRNNLNSLNPANSEVRSNDSGKRTISEDDANSAEKIKFGVEAVDNFTLKVSLFRADKDFPALVAHPLFRPIYGDGKHFETDKLNADIVTSGAFRVTSVGQDGVTLDRAENYWNRNQINLERVRFVPTENAEKALEAYRAGQIDAVTNVDFEPLALKLLEPFEDFRRSEHAALNFYEFNRKKTPFSDRRVREALAISIDRERITADEMGGVALPALKFLPFGDNQTKLTQNVEAGKKLLSDAGFPNGENFPTIRLMINRNNLQQKIARSVAKMWKQNLNIETEIVVRESNEIAAARSEGEEFDILRRGVVLPTTSEKANMQAIIPPVIKIRDEKDDKKSETTVEPKQKIENPNSAVTSNAGEQPEKEDQTDAQILNDSAEIPENNEAILTEAQAILELPGIPLYFPTSYSLVKPYVSGFEINTLDAPSLKDVRIDNNWQLKKAKSES